MEDRFEQLQILWMNNYIKIRKLIVEIDETPDGEELNKLLEEYSKCKLELDRIDKELSECN